MERVKNNASQRFIDGAMQIVSEHTGVAIADILGHSRARDCINAREYLVQIFRGIGLTYQEMAKIMNRNHPALLNLYMRHTDSISTNKHAALQIKDIMKDVNELYERLKNE